MLSSIPSSVKRFYVHTGNILNLNEIKKLTGQNQTDELVESLKITLNGWNFKNNCIAANDDSIQIVRSDEKPCNNSAEEEGRDSLKVTVKVFASATKKEVLKEALENVFTSLNVTKLDSLILACKLEPSAVLSGLQDMWSVIENLSEDKCFGDVGVSDIDTDVFVAFYNWAKVKPAIIQINLTVCCVVPPILQEFCKANNVQLLTHSDPAEILPKAALYQLFGASDTDQLSLSWAIKFQIHVKCRGVLSNKGYLICVSRPSDEIHN